MIVLLKFLTKKNCSNYFHWGKCTDCNTK